MWGGLRGFAPGVPRDVGIWMISLCFPRIFSEKTIQDFSENRFAMTSGQIIATSHDLTPKGS